MATEQFRAAVQADIEAWRFENQPAVKAFYENAPLPSESEVGEAWIDVEIRWYSGRFVSIGRNPLGRDTGTVAVAVYYREGEGTALSDQIIDALLVRLRARRLGGGVLYKPYRTVATDFKGWFKAGFLVPFTLDS